MIALPHDNLNQLDNKDLELTPEQKEQLQQQWRDEHPQLRQVWEDATYARINGVQFTPDEFFDLLRSLVSLAFDTAPTRGDFSEDGLTHHFLHDHNLI